MRIVAAALATAGLLGTHQAGAATLISEGFETPAFTPATGLAERRVSPAGWFPFLAAQYSLGTSAVDLPSPAGGRQFLRLDGVNSGVFANAGPIAANTAYTLSAAIGNQGGASFMSWSLQLFAGAVGATFLGQHFAQTPTAVNPGVDLWATNSFAFDSATLPGVVGQQLVVFLNNYRGTGASFYDTVTVVSSSVLVPEPATAALLGAAILGMAGVRSRRWA